jgi:hypothetical protein
MARKKTKPFSDDMTDEEKIAWAQQHKPKPRVSKLGTSQSNAKKNNIIKREFVRKSLKKMHSNEEKKKQHWGEKRKQREWYLYNYNEEYRLAYRYRKAVTNLRQNVKVRTWLKEYYSDIKPNLQDYAKVFKNEGIYEDFSYGFRVKDLHKATPYAHGTTKNLIEHGIIPPPIHKGYMFKGLKIEPTLSEFYTLEEVEFMARQWALFWRKYRSLAGGRDLYIKKKLWTGIKEIRDGKNKSK